MDVIEGRSDDEARVCSSPDDCGVALDVDATLETPPRTTAGGCNFGGGDGKFGMVTKTGRRPERGGPALRGKDGDEDTRAEGGGTKMVGVERKEVASPRGGKDVAFRSTIRCFQSGSCEWLD